MVDEIEGILFLNDFTKYRFRYQSGRKSRISFWIKDLITGVYDDEIRHLRNLANHTIIGRK